MNELDKLKEILSEQEWEELVSLTLSTGMTLEEIKEFFPIHFDLK
ncbi:hypothetical protein [Metabacillus fastidiosus]|uniref:DNA-binding anti-repressor SinI n=1 Tax=Metabacillus fastidiosus TaxID=1458 RepID=A0ABU6NXJ9_9BACI|nr:hypothetical protein [Metabacillus fastidiosus]MED4401368.1 hypothetical protein [Metabacillus fastidiosus]MED4463005.1 hypothetical protein [Metabacillus fastidiosus]